ncbi:MAG TPA: glycosyltransferase family 1 protein [Myxococcota bacterium]|nr:glycosyltransferase family 1 protein [Myxococcota bacterium]
MTPRVQSVALNAMFLAPGDSGGPETYLRELVLALASEYPALRVAVLTTGAGERSLRADGFGDVAALHALPAEEYRRMRRQLAEQALVQVHARRAGADLLHSLASTGPVRTPGLRSVVTLHDVTFMHTPTFGRVTTWGMTQVMKRAARDADALIAVSRAARDEICTALGLDPGRFTVVPHGVGAVPRAEPAPDAAVRERLGLGEGRVVLCVAAVRPHKNQELLVRALPHLPGDVTVVLAGRHEGYDQRLRELAAELGVSERLRLAGYLPDPELERLWLLAGCAAFPTRAEGFGLPVLEAMARGVPVACSDIPVLREVGGEVPDYFDPADPETAARAIVAALADRERGRRGVERAGRFSWADAARGTMAAYERALVA